MKGLKKGYESRFDKQGRVKEIMRTILENNPDGIDAGIFVDRVKEQAGVSRGMIFDIIKELLSKGEMTIKDDIDDRRKKIYKPNLNQIITERRIFRTTQRIEELRNPIYNEISFPYKGGKSTVHISVFGEGQGYDAEKERKSLEEMMMLYKKSAQSTNMDLNLDIFHKVILFFMVEKNPTRK